MFCSNCGQSVNKEDKFCPKCGTKVLIAELPKNDIPKVVKTEKFPFEIVLFAGIVFFVLPAIGFVTKSPFVTYDLFGKAAEAILPFSVCYYIAWLVFRRIFQGKNINKWLLKVIIFISAVLITVLAFYPEVFN